MMIHVPKVLTTEQVAECRRLLDSAEWTDGKATVGEQGALVKTQPAACRSCRPSGGSSAR